MIPLPTQVRVLVWNPEAGVPGGSHQNCYPHAHHTPPASLRNLPHTHSTSALKAGLLAGCCSHGNPIPGCPTQCFLPPPFLHPEPTSPSFTEQVRHRINKVDTPSPRPSSTRSFSLFSFSGKPQAGKRKGGESGGGKRLSRGG